MAEATFVKPPEEFAEGLNPAEAWRKWRQRYELYVSAIGYEEKTTQQQRALLLHTMGQVGFELYQTFTFSEAESGVDQSAINVLDKFDAYYEPYKNVTFASHKFNRAVQKSEQTIDQFVAEIKKLAKNCDFGNLEDRLVRDRLVTGIRDDAMRERLLREANLTLVKAVDMCRVAESSKNQVREMSTSQEICFIQQRGRENSEQNFPGKTNAGKQKFSQHGSGSTRVPKFQQHEKGKVCEKCSTLHRPRQCPAFGVRCYKCSGMNHYARCCNSKAVNVMQKDDPDDDQVYEDDSLYLGTLSVNNIECSDLWFGMVYLDGVAIRFRLDTGADVNVLPVHVIRDSFPRCKIQSVPITITTYTGQKIPVIGRCNFSCSVNSLVKPLEFYVVETNASPVLSGNSCQLLGFIKLLHNVNIQPNSSELQIILNEFSDVFSGVGRLPGIQKLHVKEGVKPFVAAARRIPQALHDSVKKELKRMEEIGVIVKETNPTEWVNAMVVVQKPDGRIRICLDPRHLNEALQREHYPIPVIGDIIQNLQGAKKFTVADAKDGFWHVTLDEESSKLCTFITPWGRYRFQVLPFGINVAPEIFQKKMDAIFENEPKIRPYFDDIALGGRDDKEHNEQLRRMLQIAQKAGLKLNKDKLQTNVEKITFLGHRISPQGIKVENDKIKAVTEMKAPTTKLELQRFLGMITYLAKFIPNVSENTFGLRQLLKKSAQWYWDAVHEQMFQQLKNMIVAAPVLAIFDPNQKIVIAADASPYGLGAVLLQNERPVEYASASLTPCQSNYAHIEKELLAIVFALEHFHVHIYGRHCCVQTDHKPLIGLRNKPLESITPRMQKFLLRLQRYDFELEYIPGKKMAVPDALSRAPGPEQIDNKEGGMVLGCRLLAVSPEKLEHLKEETRKDEVLNRVCRHVRNGWPEHKRSVNIDEVGYWLERSELYEEEGLLYKGDRLVVPETCRKDILNSLHAGHRGIVGCRAKARVTVFWPTLNSDVEKMVSSCEACAQHQDNNKQEPLVTRELPQRPWQVVAADFFELKNAHYIMIVDYFSKYVELYPTSSTKAAVTIPILKAIFARHGIPERLISDNGPPFDSEAFHQFCKDWDVVHEPVSPLFPQANGLVERGVRTLKASLKKAAEDHGDLYKVLLDYRVTPVGNLPSPAEILMGRRIRGFTPIKDSQLQPSYDCKEVTKLLKQRQEKQSEMYPNRKSLPELKVADVVWLRKEKTWIPATVIQCGPQPRSYVVKTETGGVYRRNRFHLRLRKSPSQQTADTTVEDLYCESEDDKDSVVSEPHKEVTPPVTTKSGRVVKKPVRFL